MSLTPVPRLVSFLVDCAYNEHDPGKKSTLEVLVGQWRSPAPGVKADDVWDAMVTASYGYREAPGFEAQWTH